MVMVLDNLLSADCAKNVEIFVVSVIFHDRNVNPHGILCPYEMMGICRDEDCQYIHLSRNQT